MLWNIFTTSLIHTTRGHKKETIAQCSKLRLVSKLTECRQVDQSCRQNFESKEPKMRTRRPSPKWTPMQCMDYIAIEVSYL